MGVNTLKMVQHGVAERVLRHVARALLVGLGRQPHNCEVVGASNSISSDTVDIHLVCSEMGNPFSFIFGLFQTNINTIFTTN